MAAPQREAELTFRQRLLVWVVVGAASALLAAAFHWPPFKLWIAAGVGWVCIEGWDKFVEHRGHRAELLEGKA